jgi:hypothetical protein
VLWNNGTGIYTRSNYDRVTAREYGQQSAEKFREQMTRDIPGIDRARLDVLVHEYQKHWVEPERFMARDNRLENNVFIANQTAIFEWRNYSQPSVLDPFLTATSDHNIFSGSGPDNLVRHHSGGYGSLAGLAESFRA